MKDEWPPPYEYLGARPTAWTRIIRDFGEPIPHRHSCPECYEHVLCTEPCTLEPDLEEADGTPYGSHMICSKCDPKWTAIENGLLAPEQAPKMDYSLQLELDLGA